MSKSKIIEQIFKNYAKEQLKFVETVAKLSAKPNHANHLFKSQAIDTVQPLVTNSNAIVRTNAVLTLTRLSNYSELCANRILSFKTMLGELFRRISKENKKYKKNCMNLIKNISKYSPENSEIIVKECNGIYAIKACSKDIDPFVREVTLQAINSIVYNNAKLSKLIAMADILPQIVSCLKEKKQSLKLYALFSLIEIAKNNKGLDGMVIKLPTLPYVVEFLSPNFTDIQVQRGALMLIENIVKQSLFFTEKAIELNLFPAVLSMMAHQDESIRDKSARIVNEIVRHDVKIAQMVVTAGGIVLLLNVISSRKESASSSAILALGFIAAVSPLFASAIIQSKALIHLIAILKSYSDDAYVKSDTAWTLGMIGQHSSKHSRSVRACGALRTLMDIYMDVNVKIKLKHKFKSAIQLILSKCDDFIVLEKFLTLSPPILSIILDKISKILPKNSKARRSFISNGHLKMIQELKPKTNSDLFRVIKNVNCCFPEDVVQMINGEFPESIMKKIDNYALKS